MSVEKQVEDVSGIRKTCLCVYNFFFTENKENTGHNIKTRIFPKSKKGNPHLESILEFEQKYKKNLKLQR